MDGVRKEHGFTGSTVHRDATDPNVVVIVNRVSSSTGQEVWWFPGAS